MTSREELETQAKHSVCACYYYDVCDCIEMFRDHELQSIIRDHRWCHQDAYRQGAIDKETLGEELQDCPG